MENKNIGIAIGAIVVIIIAALLLWPENEPTGSDQMADSINETFNDEAPQVVNDPAPEETGTTTDIADLSATSTTDSEIDIPVTAQAVTLTAANFKFSQNEIRVKQGDTVTITLNNEEGFHDLVIDEFGVATAKLQAGNSETVTFVADQVGTFEYYCSVGNHRAMGMKGTLIIE